MMKKIKSTFVDQVSDQQLKNDYKNLCRSERIKVAMNYLDNNKSVLEVGCSYGNISYYMAKEKGCSVDAYEINHDRLSLAKKIFSHKNISYHLGDVTKLSKWNFYDVVVLLEVIEHVENPYEFLSHLKKLLKDRGTLIISTPNANDYLQAIRNLKLYTNDGRIKKAEYVEARNKMKYGNMDDHLYSWTWDSFYRLLNRIGFSYQQSNIVGFNPISYGNFSLFKKEKPFLGKLLKPFCTNLVFKVIK